MSSRVPSGSSDSRYVLRVCPMFERPSASHPSGGCRRTRNRAANGNPRTPVSSISIRSPSRRSTLRVRNRTRLNSGSLSRKSVHQAYTSGRGARNRLVTRRSTGVESDDGAKSLRREDGSRPLARRGVGPLERSPPIRGSRNPSSGGARQADRTRLHAQFRVHGPRHFAVLRIALRRG